ncbi:amino acid ABC transporter permease [Lacrimispora sphenoides]|uniref:Glutamine transport system permease protein n=1 Tax=Lacrimispora sphenoides JCM 1415 TaxID=1297793 RepID=A0ABY1CED7_9FIRM|nr:amino acid ABC transporter permease [Lacrimispora sphenoides]SET98135.1 putative glutamine transport system permease protein [[Clostridium] sphenoides JCM 1415]SUY52939.1 polar amino acid ABC transporter inner membrane subunit [Lacrimispora sphenoides]
MLELFHQIFTPANVTFMLKGLRMTVMIAVLATVISTFFGTILALIRTYSSGKWKWAGRLVAAYTEFFRCTPNLLWILWIYFTVKGNKVGVSVFAISLFTSAVMAEIFRGGLNSIPKGQFEGAQSQGFSFIETLIFIVLPQMYKKVIPALLSQVITIIKDTSFLKMVDVAEFMRNCSVVLGSIYDVRGMLLLFGFEALCYFTICFALSCAVRGYQKTIVTG